MSAQPVSSPNSSSAQGGRRAEDPAGTDRQARRTLWVAAAGTLIALMAFTTPIASLADTA